MYGGLNNVYETIKKKSIQIESLSHELIKRVEKAGLQKLLSQFQTRINDMVSQLEIHEKIIDILMKNSEIIMKNVSGTLNAIQNFETYLNELHLTAFLPQVYMISKSKIKSKIQSLTVPIFQIMNTLIISIGIELIKHKLGNEGVSKEKTILESSEDNFTKGNKYYYGINCERNYTEAMKCYLEAAENGNTESMVKLSQCYSDGLHSLSSGQDIAAAQEWLALAAEKSNLTAIFRLAMNMIQKNENVQIAMRTITECGDQGLPEAQFWIARRLESINEIRKSIEWYERAIKFGHTKASNALALIYFYGKEEICPNNFEKAFKLFQLSAESGDENAINNVAFCLENGYGTEKNVLEAINYYRMGALRGDCFSAYSYGYLLIKEKLESDDEDACHLLVEGFEWIERAQTAGVIEAGFQLGIMYEKGIVINQNLPIAIKYYTWAAEKGHITSALYAAQLTYDSICIDNDSNEVISLKLSRTRKMYELAASQGCCEAMNALGLLMENQMNFNIDDVNINGAAQWYFSAIEVVPFWPSVKNLNRLIKENNNICFSIKSKSGCIISLNEVKMLLQKYLHSNSTQDDNDTIQNSVNLSEGKNKIIDEKKEDFNSESDFMQCDIIELSLYESKDYDFKYNNDNLGMMNGVKFIERIHNNNINEEKVNEEGDSIFTEFDEEESSFRYLLPQKQHPISFAYKNNSQDPLKKLRNRKSEFTLIV